ncbi:MAG: diguanylate cyclase [Deltaproteobacteria bacterium]|nr:MAG: diguanylate cyclase [Deltaproteobacteria bacterium]
MTGTRRAKEAAMPAALAALVILLISGAFAHRSLLAWALLAVASIGAILRWALSLPAAMPRHRAAESGLLCGIGGLALAQITGGLAYPLVYLVAAGYVLLLPLALALALIGALVGLEAGAFFAAGALPSNWPLLLSHASFVALFAALYHALLGARLLAARRAERAAVRRRLDDAEERARELRLVTTAEVDESRSLLGAVAEVEEVLRGALAVAQAALHPHSVAVFLLSPDGESVRLRECLSQSDRLLRGPLSPREGVLGAVLATGKAVRVENAADSLAYYQGRAPVSSFCGVPLIGRGALVADRAEPFAEDEERVLAALAAEVTRAIEAERLLGAVRREKEEKARFFEALEELNRTTTLAQAAQTAVAQARRMCPALDLCALTLAEEKQGRLRHRVQAVDGDAAAALRELAFADNAGLVSNVVKLGAPLPGRALGAMDRVVIFDNGTVVRGLAALKIFPLRAGDSTVGTLVCGSRSAEALPEAAQRELAMLALQAAEALVRTRLYEEAEKLATTDGLTGLLNRRTFNGQLQARVREAERYRKPLSLLLLDIDHFKRVNDSHGHPAGDAVLRGVAHVAAREARETDLCARYGGEEMAVILPETDARGALAMAERIRAAVEKAQHATESGALRVTVSVGIATTPAPSAEGLLEAADKALYRAKQNGRNRVEAARNRAAA